MASAKLARVLYKLCEGGVAAKLHMQRVCFRGTKEAQLLYAARYASMAEAPLSKGGLSWRHGKGWRSFCDAKCVWKLRAWRR